MSSHFYGITCTYGPHVVDGDGQRLGMVKVFCSKRERDAWVDADVWDGSWHRAAITSDEARACMVISPFFDWNLLESRYHLQPSEVSYATMDQVVTCYQAFFDGWAETEV